MGVMLGTSGIFMQNNGQFWRIVENNEMYSMNMNMNGKWMEYS